MTSQESLRTRPAERSNLFDAKRLRYLVGINLSGDAA